MKKNTIVYNDPEDNFMIVWNGLWFDSIAKIPSCRDSVFCKSADYIKNQIRYGFMKAEHLKVEL